MTDSSRGKRPVALAIFLILAGAIGWSAAFILTLEKFAAYANPGEKASCDFNLVVQCTENLDSPQGAIFGFPNPLMGIAGWAIVVVVGVSLLAGAKFPRWYWLLFNIGIVAALVLVIYLIGQSIFVLGTLCIYCLLTWLVTIPTFLLVTLRNLASYSSGRRKRWARGAYGWVPVISLVCYVIVAVLAQVRLDVLRILF